VIICCVQRSAHCALLWWDYLEGGQNISADWVYHWMHWVFICHGWQITTGKLRVDNFFTILSHL